MKSRSLWDFMIGKEDSGLKAALPRVASHAPELQSRATVFVSDHEVPLSLGFHDREGRQWPKGGAAARCLARARIAAPELWRVYAMAVVRQVRTIHLG
jgi:hypothetical protein